MSTSTDWANDALSEIGISAIDSIDDVDNPESIECKRLFDVSRKQYLREADPGFARREVALALASGETSNIYDYVYALPSDSLKLRYIWNTGTDVEPVIEFVTSSNTAKNSTLIMTDQEEAIMVYTADIEDLNMFNDDDRAAVVSLMASKLAESPLKRDQVLASNKKQEYLFKVAQAKTNNKRDQHKDLPDFTKYKDARS